MQQFIVCESLCVCVLDWLIWLITFETSAGGINCWFQALSKLNPIGSNQLWFIIVQPLSFPNSSSSPAPSAADAKYFLDWLNWFPKNSQEQEASLINTIYWPTDTVCGVILHSIEILFMCPEEWFNSSRPLTEPYCATVLLFSVPWKRDLYLNGTRLPG